MKQLHKLNPSTLALIILSVVVAPAFASAAAKPKRMPAEAPAGPQRPIGEIVTSLLTPDKFQRVYGKVWILMDGQSIIGSQLSEETGLKDIPDARGRFLRMANNGSTVNPDNTQLGKAQEDAYKEHTHSVTAFNSDGPAANGLSHSINGGQQPSVKVVSSPSGGNETRPKNIAVNFYIKINDCADGESPCL